MMAPVRATVLVATRDRADSLHRCLASIERDSSCPDREIVVVDNGSSDHTREVLSAHDVVALTCGQPGKSRALNLGVRTARGEIILFTDDDVIVRSGWCAALLEPFANPEVGAAGGRVVPIYPGPLEDWMNGAHLAHAALADLGPDERSLGDYDLPYGANMAIRSSLLAAIPEPFSPRLGHVGKGAMGWEEWHLLLCLRRDSDIVYVPEAVVDHHLEARRLTWPSFRRNYFLGGMGFARHLRLDGEKPPDVARRMARTARLLRRARQIRQANEGRAAPTADDAFLEFDAYAAAGQQVEALLGGLPRVTDWIAARALRG
jgi:glycosyltransferase involved in cell wall biosynthesis